MKDHLLVLYRFRHVLFFSLLFFSLLYSKNIFINFILNILSIRLNNALYGFYSILKLSYYFLYHFILLSIRFTISPNPHDPKYLFNLT